MPLLTAKQRASLAVQGSVSFSHVVGQGECRFHVSLSPSAANGRWWLGGSTRSSPTFRKAFLRLCFGLTSLLDAVGMGEKCQKSW